MTPQQNYQNTQESYLKEVQFKNELLLTQVHQLQEELDHYFKRNQELEKEKSADSPMNETGRVIWVDDELSDTIAENHRLHALAEVLRKAHQLETQNSLNVKLGNILIQGTDSLGNLLAVPGKIGKIWRESSRKNPPNSLGGKEFRKVIAEYREGGFKAVEKLMLGVAFVPTIQANAYTALARHLMINDRDAAAVAARRAYETDPKPFRLKWLAFKLHEAGNVIESEAMLDTLPTDITFSESESRQANQLRNEARHVRQHEAKQKTKFLERRAEAQKQVSELQVKITQEKEENNLLLLRLHQAQEELESQYLGCQTLEKENMEVVRQKDEQTKLVVEYQAQIEKLKQGKTSIETKLSQDIETLKQEKGQEQEENESLLLQLHQTQEELESQYFKCQTLEKAQAQIVQLTQTKTEEEAERVKEIEALNQTKENLEQEKSTLVSQKDKQEKLASKLQAQVEQLTQAKAAVQAEHGHEVKALQQVQAKLEQEKSTLVSQKDKQEKLASKLQTQVEQLTQAKAAVQAEHGHEVKALQQVQAKLEQEKSALISQKDEQEKLMAQLHGEIRETRQAASLSLKLQMLREADLQDLQTRYRSSIAQEEHQHQLLTKLGKRLSTASAYYHQIANNEPQMLPGEEMNNQVDVAKK